MTGVVPVIPRFKFTDPTRGNGPLSGGSVTVYLAGTTTLASVFQDKELTVSQENPVPLDANGEALFWVDSSRTYKFLAKDEDGATIPGWPVDNIPGSADIGSAATAAADWASKTTASVDGAEFSAKEYAQGAQAATGGSAKNWAQQTGADVTGATANSRSSKSWAQDDLAGATLGGSAKDWAQSASLPDGSSKSAKSYAADADTARIAAEAARDATNTTGKVFDDTTAGIAGTSSGQTFAVIDTSLQFWIVYKNNAGSALEVSRTYTKAYLDAFVQVRTSLFPYIIPFTALDSSGNERVLGGFDRNGKFDLGAIDDIAGRAQQVEPSASERPGWMVPFVASDAAGVERVLGGFDQLGRFLIGSKIAVKEDDYAFSYIGPTSSIVCWGDSLTEGSGGTPYPQQLGTLLGVTVSNQGYGGQNTEKIVSRQGGYCALLTVSGNQIPTSGAVSVTMGTAILSYPSATSKSITGAILTLSGAIAGTLTKDAAGAYTFTRTVAGDAATVLPNTPFQAEMSGYDYGINILWAGANDVGTSSISTVSSFVDRFVESIKTVEKRFLILSPIADSSFTSATSGYTNMRSVIEALKLRYPRNFLDVQERLVNSYNAGIPQDVIDFANKVTPSSLRADTIHLNTSGYALVAGWVRQFLVNKGWA